MADRYAVLKHRSSFDLYSVEGDRDPFMTAAEMVVDWVVQKESQYNGSPIVEDLGEQEAFPLAWNYGMPEDYYGGDYDDDRWPALATASVSDEEGQVVKWVVEYDEPDNNHDDRRWHTVICLERVPQTQACRISLESMCRPVGKGEPLPDTVAAPALVRDFIELPWFVAKAGTVQLQKAPNKLTQSTFEHFKNDLLDPGRTIPLVLFCTGYDSKIPEHAKQLARRALATANVYIVDWADEGLRTMVQNLFERGTAAGEYNCPKSSARMYMPGVDLTDPHKSRAHESWNRDALAAVHPSRFAEHLARRFIPTKPVTDIAELQREDWE